MPRLSRQALMKLARTHRQVKAIQRGPDTPARNDAFQSPEVQDIEITGTSTTAGPGGAAMYPGKILDFDSSDGTDTQLATCWVLSRNGGTLSTGKVLGRLWGDWTDGVPIFRVDAIGGGPDVDTRVAVQVEVASTTAVTIGAYDYYPGYLVSWSNGFSRTAPCWVIGENNKTLLADYYGGWIGDAFTDIDYNYKNATALQSGTSSGTLAVTTNRPAYAILISVEIFTAARTVSGVSFLGNPGTLVKAQANGSLRVETWVILDDLSGPTTNDITVTLSGNANWIATAVVYGTVDQTTPTEGATGSTSASVGIPVTTSGAWGYAAIVSDDSSITAGTGSSRNNVGSGGTGSGADMDTGVAQTPGTTTLSYSGMSGNAAMAGCAIRPGNVPVVFVTDPLKVAEDDGSPSVPVRDLQVDHTTMTLTSVSPGVAKISMIPGGSDVKAKVSSADTTTNYLSNKIVSADASVTVAITSPGGDERLDLSVSGSSVTNLTVTNLTVTNILNALFQYNSLTVVNYVTISSSQNNYSVSISVYILVVNCTSASDITGIAIGGGNLIGRPLTIINVGSADLTLPHQSGSSTSGNTFYNPGGASYTIPAGGGMWTGMYGDGSRWMADAPAYQSLYSIAKLTDPGADRIAFWDDSASDWAFLTAGTGLSISGTTLSATGGSGTVTSVGLSSDASYLTIGSTPVTTSGTITANKTTGLTANQFVGTPNGSTGAADLRAIVAADLPTGGYGHGISLRSNGTTTPTGSTKSDAATIVYDCTEVTAANGTKGLILPDTPGIYTVRNSTAGIGNLVYVYPPAGGVIGGLSADTPVTVNNTPNANMFCWLVSGHFSSQTIL